ncbi:MAG: hypothetical protein JNK14_18990 [Chitinophagaceae bacterium]|nr:hypothetical protein [Chitinophagaceae bacterium]
MAYKPILPLTPLTSIPKRHQLKEKVRLEAALQYKKMFSCSNLTNAERHFLEGVKWQEEQYYSKSLGTLDCDLSASSVASKGRYLKYLDCIKLIKEYSKKKKADYLKTLEDFVHSHRTSKSVVTHFREGANWARWNKYKEIFVDRKDKLVNLNAAKIARILIKERKSLESNPRPFLIKIVESFGAKEVSVLYGKYAKQITETN